MLIDVTSKDWPEQKARSIRLARALVQDNWAICFKVSCVCWNLRLNYTTNKKKPQFKTSKLFETQRSRGSRSTFVEVELGTIVILIGYNDRPTDPADAAANPRIASSMDAMPPALPPGKLSYKSQCSQS